MTKKSLTVSSLRTEPTHPTHHSATLHKKVELDHKVIGRRIKKSGYEVF